ncbi:hypothetical protein LB507_010501 [Fusarium sp. FIESC RH6]|nr:hypothetical protein LB507_010501 [Fusarium sp. FIESC RH6]
MPKTSNSSSSDGSEIDAEVFGPLASISEDSLRALASRVARDVGISTDNRFDNIALIRRICGSYNIVHIMEVETTKLVIRVPAFGWGDGMSKAAADALKSQVATMRLIRKKTKVPVPEVFSFDETDKNEINAPFICLEFILAEAEKSSWDRASNKMLEALVQSSPNLNSHSRFVLFPPEFDSQNILVGPESGNIVGLIDWDLCHTMPPHMGYARYPGFITRDWDPLIKGILRKFIEVALEIEDKGALAVLYDLDRYCSPEDWNKLKGKLEQLVYGSSYLSGAS